ncbi:MAG: phage GP46 family protein [Magnetospirillum sp.]|nr:phage GP46 family protein [Magnetospirillum sp.]
MSDTTTVWSPRQGRGDWSASGGLLATGADLYTAALISLFSDRRAAADDAITDGSGDARGWWGDLGSDYPVGSRLWLLERSTLTAGTALLAQDYAREALQWLLDDGVVAGWDIAATVFPPATLGLTVAALFQDGSRQAFNFTWAWGTV